MIEAIRNALKIPDLRKKILFTLFILLIYRLGAHIPVPGVNIAALKALFAKESGIFGFLDLFTGGALSNFAIFSLGIMPYITASIIMQLLTVAIPKLEEWQKEGEVGQRKITQMTRYFTLVLAIVESIGYTLIFQAKLGTPFSVLGRFLIVITLTAGTALIMWLGELITERGIGNGMSLIIFASIVSKMPQAVIQTFRIISPLGAIGFFVILFVILIAIIVMEKGQRRIPVQYAKRVVGRKMYSGGSTYIPLKINSAGVIPIIFASALLQVPATLSTFFPGKLLWLQNSLKSGSLVRILFETVLIVFFAYFYTAIVFNPIELADNIKKYGGFVPGVRPGRPTAIHLDKVLNRITLPGSIFLAGIAILPDIFGGQLGIPFFQNYGGTSMLIMVGVALETMMQLEAQLLQRHYEGFLR